MNDKYSISKINTLNGVFLNDQTRNRIYFALEEITSMDQDDEGRKKRKKKKEDEIQIMLLLWGK